MKSIYGASEILDKVHKRKNLLGMSVICSAINMYLSLLAFYWLMIAVHAPIPFTTVLAFMPMSIFIGLIPLTLAGMGTRDAAIIYFLKPYAISSKSLSASLIFALQGYWAVALFFLPLLFIYLKNEPATAD